MKPSFITFLFIALFNIASAQNVGIGTNNPHGSAQLDISSTTKGLLAPRMTTAQRGAIASPAKGLLVSDTDPNSLFAYNGSAWASVGGGGGNFSLPFEGSVNLAIPGIKVTNDGMGPAIQAITTNEFGIALSANNTANYGYSIYAFSRSPNAVSVYGIADSATAVKAESSRGIGIDAKSNDSMAIRARILVGANAYPAILATHAGIGNAVEGSSSTGSGIMGTSNAPKYTNNAGVKGISTTGGFGVIGEANYADAIGVQGNSTYGTAVRGTTTTGDAIRGNSTDGDAVVGVSAGSGDALKGFSTSGYGLYSSGKMRITGGNTNPSAGAVLTSIDANGNAVWKPTYKVAFKAHTAYSALKGFPSNASGRKLHFATEAFDYGGNFTATTSGSPSADMSTFLVPVNGLYHFDIGIKVTLTDTYDDFEEVYAFLRLTRGGIDYTLHFITSQCCNANLGYNYGLNGSTDVQLVQGDRIWVQFYQRNDDAAVGNVTSDYTTSFSGHLVFAD